MIIDTDKIQFTWTTNTKEHSIDLTINNHIVGRVCRNYETEYRPFEAFSFLTHQMKTFEHGDDAKQHLEFSIKEWLDSLSN